ncbi:MAG: hypothetical protein CME15_11535 [Gemmatimonadetes bacterium]|nr:hypothetical protein [Gemmatimonadota bacterium]
MVDENEPVEDIVADPVTAARQQTEARHPRIPLPRDLYGERRPNARGIDLTGDKQAHTGLSGGEDLLLSRRRSLGVIVKEAAGFGILPGQETSSAGTDDVEALQQGGARQQAGEGVAAVPVGEDPLRGDALQSALRGEHVAFGPLESTRGRFDLAYQSEGPGDAVVVEVIGHRADRAVGVQLLKKPVGTLLTAAPVAFQVHGVTPRSRWISTGSEMFLKCSSSRDSMW